MTRVEAPRLLAALDQRVSAAAGVLGHGVPEDDHDAPPGARASGLLPVLVESCRRSGSLAETWLVMCAATARLPWADDVRQLARFIRAKDTTSVVTRLMEEVIEQRHQGHPELELDIVVGGVVVDVDFCARHDYNSGIQRVVRRTLPRWADAGHVFTPTAWTRSRDAARTLADDEWQRVFAHKDTEAEDQSRSPGSTHEAARLVVPWRGTLVLIEVPVGSVCRSIAAVAELSGNEVSCVGYDAIPVVNAELRPAEETDAFAGYLAMLKHARTVAGISRTSAAEFRSFVATLPAQGLTGPEVTAVLVPDDSVGQGQPSPSRPPDGTVSVLLAGAREPHKNHRAALQAAERLWREGLEFEVVMVGGAGWHPDEVDEFVSELVQLGRPLRPLGRVSDEDLDRAYRDADVAVFVSLQEGFGLPAAEALASGTPVLTTGFGSLAEVAAGGGALTADPRDDDDITDRLRELVLDADLRMRLGREASRRTIRTWDQFADELWAAVAGGRR